nr:BlaI/MecI/CopY family transcriptional regulator [uncultured Anaerobutyricum sp.]
MSSHLSKTEYEIMEYFWEIGDKYTFGELMKYFNENLNKNWKKQTLNTFLSRLIEKGLLKKEKEGTKTSYQMNITKAQFKQNKARAILEESYDGKISHFIAALTGNDAITDVDEQELLSQLKAIKSNS